MAAKLEEEQEPVSKGGGCLPLYVSRFAWVNDNRARHVYRVITLRNERGKGVTLFCNPERCASTKTFVEELGPVTAAFAESHVCTEAQTPEGRYFKPERSDIREPAWGCISSLFCVRLRCEGLACHDGHSRMAERFEDVLEPVWLWAGIVVDESDDLRGTGCQSSVARTAEARHRFDDVTGTRGARGLFRGGVAGGVVDNEDFAGAGRQPL